MENESFQGVDYVAKMAELDLSLVFKEMVGQLIADGQTEVFDHLITLIFDLGRAGEVDSALRYLDELQATIKSSNHLVTVADLKGRHRCTNLKQRLRQLVGYHITPTNVPHRLMGSLSHSAILDLMTGRRPSSQEFATLCRDGEVNEIVVASNELQVELRRAGLSNDPFAEHQLEQRIVPELEQLLQKIYQEHFLALQLCREKFGTVANYPYMLVLATWGQAVNYVSYIGQRPCFVETAVIDREYGLSGGRLDALEVLQINDRAPDRSQGRIIRALSSRRYKSVGHVMTALVKNLGTFNIAERINELKFAVGDGVGMTDIIMPQQIARQMLPENARQLARYSSFSTLGLELLSLGQTKWLEQVNRYFNRAQILYLLPSTVIIHNYQFDEGEKKTALLKQLVRPWDSARERAERQAKISALVGLVVNDARGRVGRACTVKMPQPHVQGELFLDQGANGSVAGVIEQHRHYIDPENIIEQVGVGQFEEPIFQMDVRQLFAAIAKGAVKVSASFSGERGGHICCIFPDHSEDTPSMCVYLDRGYFRCFGRCGRRGGFKPGSVPKEMELKIKEWARNRKDQHRIDDKGQIIVPHKHHEIMLAAQILLQQDFLRSRGESYIFNQRRLNPELAFGLGAGFGTDRLVHGLLDQGYSLPELVDVGLIEYTTNIQREKSLYPLLRNRGLLDEEIIRTVLDRERGIQKAYPRLPLKNRVTFPLTWLNQHGQVRHASFYGRATWSTGLGRTHYKLSTPVGHGGFNMTALASKEHQMINITEAVIDALTLIQMGYPATIAIIGVNNYAVLQAVVNLGKDIALAFDNDTTGRQKTDETINWLMEKAGHSHILIDRTSDLMFADYPSLANYKDLNEWWIKKGRNII